MNLQGVIERLQNKANNIKMKCEPEYFMECAEYLEQFKWHDLRKGDELPEQGEACICMNSRGTLFVAKRIYSPYENKTMWVGQGCTLKHPIKWAKIMKE